MKICYLADVNSSHTRKWCRYFVEKGHDVSVVSLSDGTIEGVKVYSLGIKLNVVKNEGIFHKFKYLLRLAKVKKIVNMIKPDILHAHYASSYGLLGSLCSYTPYIVSVWGSDVYDFPKRNIIAKKIIKYNLSKANKIFSTSIAMANETKKYTDKPIFITPFGVDLNIFKKLYSCQRNESYMTIGTVKALEKNYGIDYLIKAFSIVKKQVNNVKLEIGGVGSQKTHLEGLVKRLGIKEDVVFLGFLEQNDVVQAFNRFDIAIFPSSIIESFGVAAVEAQACGVPVIVTDIGGLPEATRPGYSSIVVEKKSVESLAEAILKLVNNKALREQMGNNAINFVKKNYNIEDNFYKITEIYKETINEAVIK